MASASMIRVPPERYYIVGADTERVWSSKAKGYVAAVEDAYLQWRSFNRVPISIESETALWDLLRSRGEEYLTPPLSLTRRQFFLQLRASGLRDQVLAWIGSQDPEVQDAFENSGSFLRTEPMLQAGFVALGYSTEQIDSFFADGAAL